MKNVYILTANQAEILNDILNEWEYELEKLRGELERVTIREKNEIEEIADRMESLNRVMRYTLSDE